MAQKNIICPYCGYNMVIDVTSESKTDFICEFCGSNLEDEVKELMKSMKESSSSKPVDFSSPNFQSPFQKKASSQKPAKKPDFSAKKNKPTLNSPFPQENVHAFPRSQFVKDHSGQTVAPGRKYSRSKGKRQKDQINPPAGGAFLDMPQIKQKILIPPHNKEFHFGRNNVLGLIGPSQEYDLEWLNSISRVQKGKNNKFVRQHFFITKENNQFYIEDKQSSWGTWVNGRQIKGLGKIPLKNGDKIELKLGKPGVDQIIPFVLHFSC